LPALTKFILDVQAQRASCNPIDNKLKGLKNYYYSSEKRICGPK